MSALDASWWRMWRSGRNALRHIVLEQPLRGISVAMVLLLVWAMLGGLFAAVLAYLGQSQFEGFKGTLVESLLSLFFFSLLFLVTISDAVLVWSALFRSCAAAFHAQLPLSDRQLFWSASVEGGLWSSWAVLVLMMPLLGALVADAWSSAGSAQRPSPAADLLAMIAGGGSAMVAFVLCCAAAGALGAQLLARLIPALRRGLKGIIALVVAGVMLLTVLALGSYEHRAEPASIMNAVIGDLRFAENPYLPASWAQQALSGALGGQWRSWGYHMLLLASTAAALLVAGEWVAGRRLRIDLDALTGRPDTPQRTRSRRWRQLPGLPADLGLLVAKDLRLFLRDPAQLLQFTLFFAILAFYLLLLPRVGKAFHYDAWWRPVVSLLNLTAVAMALATFTGRFVYPMLSLEGKRLWILVLAPWPRERVVSAKFAFALLVGMPVSVTLVVLSGVMLELSPGLVAYQALIMACMVVGFSSAALGLGARLADYAEDNAAKLVAGYGGTVNLMASLLFTALLMAGAALPLLAGATALGQGLGGWRWVLGLAWTVAVTAAWSTVSLRMAWRWFARAP
jgi:ABC-2 type transport system permease protein